jgi:hypothetical protein
MSDSSNNKNIFLRIGFESSSNQGTLKKIELFGVPGKSSANNQIVISPSIRSFFDDLIARVIFRKARLVRECDFQALKIWLYDTEIKNPDRGYQIPPLDEQDLEITSNVSSSKLETIYVLDNQLTGREYEQWAKIANEIFSPLFLRFSSPPEMPTELANLPLVKLIESSPLVQLIESSPFGKAFGTVSQTLNPYNEMKQKLFFNALIIQID